MDQTIYNILTAIPAFLFAISFHEFSHGKVAYWLGDRTAYDMGRLTLNPIPHIDPIGLFVLIATQRIGWAKPVPVNPRYFKDPRRGMLYVGIAGPISNILVALLVGVAIRLWALTEPYLVYRGITSILSGTTQIVWDIVFNFYIINIALAIFNLLPIPPLDGSRVLAGIVPRKYAHYLAYLEHPATIVILVFLAYMGFLEKLIVPVLNYGVRLLLL